MMLTEGTENYRAEELNDILDHSGIFLNSMAGRDTAGINMFFMNGNVKKALELAVEILFRPVFPKNELEILLKKRLARFRIAREKVQTLSNDQFFESVFGESHPYGRKVSENDFEKITDQILRDFHASFYSPANMTVIISGKLRDDTIELSEQYLGKLDPGTKTRGEPGFTITGSGKKKVHIDKPGSVQSSVKIGSATINKRHPDYPGLKIVNTILGGYFGSRLMKNLREDKGYTYGIHSSVSSLDQAGFKIISTETGKEFTSHAIDEIYREINILQNEPVETDELTVLQNYLSGEMLRMFDGPFAIADSFKAVWKFGLDLSYYDRMMHTLNNITPEEIMNLAARYYKIDELYEITAG